MDKSKNELSVLATVNDTFEYPFGKFKDHAISKGWASSETQFKFVFDGDTVKDTQTPENFDMEEGELIEVYYC